MLDMRQNKTKCGGREEGDVGCCEGYETNNLEAREDKMICKQVTREINMICIKPKGVKYERKPKRV